MEMNILGPFCLNLILLFEKQNKLYINTEIWHIYLYQRNWATRIFLSHSDKVRSGSHHITPKLIQIICNPTQEGTMNVLSHYENSGIGSQKVTFDSI